MFILIQMEEKVKDLNEQLQQKSKERLLLSIQQNGGRGANSMPLSPHLFKSKLSCDQSGDLSTSSDWMLNKSRNDSARTACQDHLIILTEPSSDSGLPVSNEQGVD